MLRDDVAGDPGDYFSLVAAEKTLNAATEQPNAVIVRSGGVLPNALRV